MIPGGLSVVRMFTCSYVQCILAEIREYYLADAGASGGRPLTFSQALVWINIRIRKEAQFVPGRFGTASSAPPPPRTSPTLPAGYVRMRL